MENIEIWKNIKEYPDYEVSNLGNIKSLKHGKEKIKKQHVNTNGYLSVSLLKNGKQKTKTIHQLVAICFLYHEPDKQKLVINHKDFNRLNNNIENLEIVTTRENTNQKHFKSSSSYVGVSWCNTYKKWYSSIRIKGKTKNLGYYFNEIEASNAYENKLKEILI